MDIDLVWSFAKNGKPMITQQNAEDRFVGTDVVATVKSDPPQYLQFCLVEVTKKVQGRIFESAGLYLVCIHI